MGVFRSYLQSDDFKKSSRQATDSAIKTFFRFLSWSVIGVRKFMGNVFKMAFGIKR